MENNTRDTIQDITSIKAKRLFDPNQITTDRVLSELQGFLTNQQMSWFNSLERKWQREIIQGAKWDGLAATVKHIKWLFDRALIEMFDRPNNLPFLLEDEEIVPAEVLQDQTPLPDPPAAVQAVINHSFPDAATETAKGRLQAQFDDLKRKGAK
jgi:hypothetical protein